MSFALFYNKGSLYVKSIKTNFCELKIYDGRDECGKIKFRNPRIWDSTSDGVILFIGTEDDCLKELKK